MYTKKKYRYEPDEEERGIFLGIVSVRHNLIPFVFLINDYSAQFKQIFIKLFLKLEYIACFKTIPANLKQDIIHFNTHKSISILPCPNSAVKY